MRKIFMWERKTLSIAHLLRLFRKTTILFVMTSGLYPSGTATAQENTVDPVKEIQRALQHAEYQAAADLADSAIVHFEKYSPAQLAEIHALRGLIAFERNEGAAVDAHFLSALQLAPDHQLDPIFFSPALQGRFELLRAKMPKNETPVRVETRYVMLPDPRLKAAWKSAILPGWGQRSKGQKSKGQVFTISVAVLAGATIAAHVLRERAEDDYLAATEENVVSRYDTYNRYHQWRNSLALGLGIVWGAAVLDALIVPAPAPKVGFIPSNSFAASPMLLSVTWHF
jgi:hypothetical protein